MEAVRHPELHLGEAQLDELQEYFLELSNSDNPLKLQSLIAKTTKRYWGSKNSAAGVLLLLTDQEHPTLYTELIPWVSGLLLRARSIFPTPIRLLQSYRSEVVEYTLEQLVVILSIVFFGMSTEPHSWFLVTPIQSDSLSIPSQRLKVNAFIDFLVKRRELDPEILRTRKVSFERVVDAHPMPFAEWTGLDTPLIDVEIYGDIGIEDYAHPCLQVDFANEFIGGGTLSYGNVQEELMFSVHPELIASMVFTQKMEDNEGVVIIGAEKVSSYRGYGNSATYTGSYQDTRGIDERGRLNSHVVAIDALILIGRKNDQYEAPMIERELNKAYVGFLGDFYERDAGTPLRPVCTGKWGCGMFMGDPQLKFLLQWAAASRAGRKCVFMTFGDRNLEQIDEIVAKFKDGTVGQLISAIDRASSTRSVFETLLSRVI